MKASHSIFPAAIGCALLVGGLKWLADRRCSRARSAAAGAAQPQRYAAIEAYLQAQMARLNIPGAALAVVEGDQIAYLRGFGRARPGGEPPWPQTPFLIGSLTKSITALAVMQLVEAGWVSLDAPVQTYLPWFQIAPPRGHLAAPGSSPQISVRHLLNQTSGLPMSAGMKTLANFDDRPGAMERQARAALAKLALSHPPGTTSQYSNLNYDLLGLIVAAASQETYPEYVQRHIFTPLGMQHSYTSQAAAKQNGLAVGYRYWFGVPIAAPNLPIPPGSLASGQLVSCLENMARYLSAHLNGGRCGGVQILSEAGMRELHHGAAEFIQFGVSSGRYAMGWFETGDDSDRTVYHGGNVPDFSSYMGFLPAQQKGLVLLTNADHFGLPPILAEVGWGATRLMAGRQPGPARLGLIPWLMRLLALIPLLQIAGAAAGLLQLRRWQRDPAQRPGRGQAWRQLLPGLLVNLAFAALPLYWRAQAMLGYLRLFMPDVYWTFTLGGGFAGAWTVVQTGLALSPSNWQPLIPAGFHFRRHGIDLSTTQGASTAIPLIV